MSLYLRVDGHSWEVERRYEVAHVASYVDQGEPKLFLFFHGSDGELRRSEVPRDFSEDPDASVLETVWRYAEVLRAGSPGEMVSQASLTVPSIRNAIKLMWRAVRLRCPQCGGKGILKSWFALKTRCPTCGIRFERGEESDYYLGGMLFNLVLAELIFAVGFTVSIIVLWPNVPWDGLEYILAGAMLVAPIALYPVSHVLWLAFDLLLRPATPEEMAWHARSPDND